VVRGIFYVPSSGRSSACRMNLLLRVFKQVVEIACRAGALPFPASQLVNPAGDGVGGFPRFILFGTTGGGPALLDSRFSPPLSLGEFDYSDSMVCAHVG
jgi:hypothetical protein